MRGFRARCRLAWEWGLEGAFPAAEAAAGGGGRRIRFAVEGWRRQGLEALAGRGLLEAAAWEQQRRQEVEAGLAAETARAAGLEEALAAAERRAEWRAQLEQCRAGVVRRRSFAFVPVVPLAEGDGREWDGREAERDDDPQLQHALLMEQMQRDRQMLAEDAAQHADSRECRQRQELELFGLKAGPGDGGYGEAEEYEGVASASPASVRSECDEETWAAFYGLVQRCFDANHDGHIDVAGMRSFLSAVGAGETDAFHSAGWAESWAAICGSLGADTEPGLPLESFRAFYERYRRGRLPADMQALQVHQAAASILRLGAGGRSNGGRRASERSASLVQQYRSLLDDPGAAGPSAWAKDKEVWVELTVRAHPGRSSARSVSHSEYVLYGAFVWARRALKRQKRRFPAPPCRRRRSPKPCASAGTPRFGRTAGCPRHWTAAGGS